jgi:RNA polymerase sigma-B factor
VTEGVDEISLWRRYAATRRRIDRNELIERHLGLARHIARRYSRRGTDDDLTQVAFLALVKAVERFDVDRGVQFSSYAGRTIEGEIKRHFRDASWSVRVPRGLKENALQIDRTSETLAQQLGRAPTPAELADHLELDLDDVLAAIAAGTAHTASSLDAPAADRDTPAFELGDVDEGFEHVADSAIIERLLDGLPERDRAIVRLRFYGDLSQAAIAERVGISQMHVSRLLRRSLEAMRATLDLERGEGRERSEPAG